MNHGQCSDSWGQWGVRGWVWPGQLRELPRDPDIQKPSSPYSQDVGPPCQNVEHRASQRGVLATSHLPCNHKGNAKPSKAIPQPKGRHTPFPCLPSSEQVLGGPAGYGSSDVRGASNQSKLEHSDVERESTRRPNTVCDLITAAGGWLQASRWASWLRVRFCVARRWDRNPYSPQH